MPPTSLPLVDEPRTDLLRVPVTPAEKAQHVALAASEGRSVSEYVRLRLASTPTPRTDPLANVEPLGIAFTMRDEDA